MKLEIIIFSKLENSYEILKIFDYIQSRILHYTKLTVKPSMISLQLASLFSNVLIAKRRL